MKKFKLTKVIASTLVVASVLALNPIRASAEWKHDRFGLWWYTEGNSWFTGWRYIDGNWYYFYNNGYMAYNTVIDGYYLNGSGIWSNNEPSPEFTYEQALKIFEKKYEKSSDTLIGGSTTPNYKNDEKYYRIQLASKSIQAAGGTGTMGSYRVFVDGRIEKI